MIRPLRKYHFFIWRLAAFLLPLLFFLAIWLRPNSFENYQGFENDFSFNLKKLTDSTAQVIIDVKNSLKVPSCLVYVSFSTKDVLLGTLNRRGLYNFEVKTKEQEIRLRLYDAIHKREIALIQLTDNNE